MARELAKGAQHRERIDAGMRRKALILSGEQHLAIERIDAIGDCRQAPLAVGAQKATQDRSVARQDEPREMAAALQRRPRQREIGHSNR